MVVSAYGERTVCGSGVASAASTADAVRGALEQARAPIGEAPADLGFLFVSPGLELSEAMTAARALLPATDFAGCSTAGEITERGLSFGGVAALLIRWGEASHALKLTPRTDQALGQVARQLQQPLLEKASDLGRRAACVVLGDGLSPMFEQVVMQFKRGPQADTAIVGGGAADGHDFRRTQVALNELSAEGGMVCVQVMTKHPWGVGVAHGLRFATPRMTVTKSRGNVVETIDGQPAFEVYRQLAAGMGVAIEPATAAQFLVENELGVLLFEDLVRVRAPLRVEPDGSLYCAGEVPEGSTICVVRGDPDEIVEAARTAAEAARDGLRGARPAGVLVFSCVCRGMVLKDRYADEVDSLRSVFPGVPIAGFSSYGEVAFTSEKLDGYHNDTIVVAAIPE